MDPDATLAQLRQAIETLWAAESSVAAASAADSIAEHATALDQWLSRGGFLPAAWSRR
jgi:hypothetical protein